MTPAATFCFVMAGICMLMLCGIAAIYLFPPSPLGSQEGEVAKQPSLHFTS